MTARAMLHFVGFNRVRLPDDPMDLLDKRPKFVNVCALSNNQLGCFHFLSFVCQSYIIYA